MSDARKVNKVNHRTVKTGDVHAFTYWGKITAVRGDTVDVEGLDQGQGKFSVCGASLIENSASADQFSEVVKVSKTQAAELLASSYHRPFTVVFEKQDGSERTLRGRLIEHEPFLGRSYVEDLDIRDGRPRLVDHRTIASLVIDGVKYQVK